MGVVDRRGTARRLVQLHAGLCLFGVSTALMVRAELGLIPWDVFHQGLAGQTGLRIGVVTILVGVALLLAWVPLRQRPGYGTLSNVVVVGLVVDLTLWLVSPLGALDLLPVRWGLLVTGVVLNGIATGCYIGAGFGAGPRDGLMTGLAARGHSVRVVRTSIEVAVLASGFLLGGTVGAGTVLYAVCIGPLAHTFIPRFSARGPAEDTSDTASAR